MIYPLIQVLTCPRKNSGDASVGNQEKETVRKRINIMA